MRITDLQDKPRGIVFGYACHNTTLFPAIAATTPVLLRNSWKKITRRPSDVCDGLPRRSKSPTAHGHRAGICQRTWSNAGERRRSGRRPALNNRLVDHCTSPTRASCSSWSRSLPSSSCGAGRKQHSRASLTQGRYLLSLIDAGKDVPTTQDCPLHVAAFGTDLLMVFISGETVVVMLRAKQTSPALLFGWQALAKTCSPICRRDACCSKGATKGTPQSRINWSPLHSCRPSKIGSWEPHQAGLASPSEQAISSLPEKINSTASGAAPTRQGMHVTPPTRSRQLVRPSNG